MKIPSAKEQVLAKLTQTIKQSQCISKQYGIGYATVTGPVEGQEIFHMALCVPNDEDESKRLAASLRYLADQVDIARRDRLGSKVMVKGLKQNMEGN